MLYIYIILTSNNFLVYSSILIIKGTCHVQQRIHENAGDKKSLGSTGSKMGVMRVSWIVLGVNREWMGVGQGVSEIFGSPSNLMGI